MAAMPQEIQTVVAIAVPAVGALAWLFRLQARLDVHDANYASMKDDLREIKGDVKKIRSFMGGTGQ
jgi:hypothetical protein